MGQAAGHLDRRPHLARTKAIHGRELQSLLRVHVAGDLPGVLALLEARHRVNELEVEVYGQAGRCRGLVAENDGQWVVLELRRGHLGRVGRHFCLRVLTAVAFEMDRRIQQLGISQSERKQPGRLRGVRKRRHVQTNELEAETGAGLSHGLGLLGLPAPPDVDAGIHPPRRASPTASPTRGSWTSASIHLATPWSLGSSPL